MYDFRSLKSDMALAHQCEKDVGDFLRTKTRTPKLYSTDLRHQYTAAVFTQVRGAAVTRFLGEMNEIFNFSGSGAEDSKIDRRNNELGIQYGLSFPRADRNKLLNIIFSDIEKNREKERKLPVKRKI